jgi:hypothetical protein
MPTCALAAQYAGQWDELFAYQADVSLQWWIQEHSVGRFALLPPFYRPACLKRYGAPGSDNTKLLMDVSAQVRGANPASPCTVFSIGGNKQVEFEQSILDNTPCNVYTFDCTVSEADMVPIIAKMTGAKGRMNFRSYCVGKSGTSLTLASSGRFATHKLYSLHELMQKYNLVRIDVLKFDAEGAEHVAFPELISDAKTHKFDLPQQISAEVHFADSSAKTTMEGMRTFQMLFHAGYVLVSNEENYISPGCCMEFTLALGCDAVTACEA